MTNRNIMLNVAAVVQDSSLFCCTFIICGSCWECL